MLEATGEALGIVTAIAAQTRLSVTVVGDAGHAGTVPMAMRRDALAAAAEMMSALEASRRRPMPRISWSARWAGWPSARRVERHPGARRLLRRPAIAERHAKRDAALARIPPRRSTASPSGGGSTAWIERVHDVERDDLRSRASPIVLEAAVQAVGGDAVPRLPSGRRP